jgi:3-dehydroquinate synthase
MVNLGGSSCPVYVGSSILSSLGMHVKSLRIEGEVILLTVPPVRRLYGELVRESLLKEGITAEVMEVPDGEAAKTVDAYMDVIGKLLEIKAGRDSLFISFGGGCVGDLTGFLAATYMRGTKLVHVPTTLLAQVDASVGGKTALNHPKAKNLIGAIYGPEFVLSDTVLLKTLPPKEIGCGMAEMIKCGAILDGQFFRFLETETSGLRSLAAAPLEKAVSSAIRLKAAVVARDEFDHDMRMLLNFGHTVGHAIEAATGYGVLSHGEAVAVGMIAEAMISRGSGFMTSEEERRLENLISAYGLPTHVKGTTSQEIMGLMEHDKKFKAGRLRISIPMGIGKGMVIEAPPRELVIQSIEGVLGD